MLAERAYQELYQAQKEAALGEILRVIGQRDTLEKRIGL
jgi:hypothetical protein